MQAPAKESKQLFLQFAALEETYGLARSAMEVYDRAVRTVVDKERFEVYTLYLARATQFFGVGKVHMQCPVCIVQQNIGLLWGSEGARFHAACAHGGMKMYAHGGMKPYAHGGMQPYAPGDQTLSIWRASSSCTYTLCTWKTDASEEVRHRCKHMWFPPTRRLHCHAPQCSQKALCTARCPG